MGRYKETERDVEYKKIISANLNKLLDSSNRKKIDINKELSIPKSTITDYFKGRTLPSPKNLEKLAKFFGVAKSDIDPRFKPVTNDKENKPNKIEDILDSAMTFNGKPLT